MVLADVDAAHPVAAPSPSRLAPVVTAGVLTLAAVGLSIWAGSFAPALLLQILALGLALRPSRIAVGIAASVLITCAVALVLITVPIRLGMPLPWWITPALMLVTIAASVWRATSVWPVVRTGFRGVPAAAVVGPLGLLATVLIYAMRWGPIPAWAMSGDARNHLLTTDAILQAGGWTFLTAYPALENSLVALVTIPHATDPLGTALVLDIQTMAQTMLVLFVLVGGLGGMIAAGGGATVTAAAQLRAAVASCLVLSPLLLGGVLIGGFHAAPLAVLLLIALTGWLALDEHSWWSALGVSAVTGVLLVTCYPLIAPMAMGVLLGWWITRGPGWTRAATFVAAAALLLLGLLILALWVIGSRPDLAAILVASGGIARRNPALIVAPVLLALVSWWANRTWSQARGVAIVVAGTLFLAVVIAWLAWLSGEYSYYAQKSLWLGVVGLLPVAAARLGPVVDDSLPRGLAPVVVLGGLSFVPLLFGASGAPLPSANIVQGWAEPSAEQVELVEDLPNMTPHNYLWRVFGGLYDRPVNNWLSSWNAPVGDINFSQLAMSWTYSPAAELKRTYCRWLAAQPGSVVWTASAGEAASLLRTCRAASPDRVRVVQPAG